MLELFSNIAAGFGLRDLVDVVLVSIIVYRVFMIVRGTNAVQMITGLLFLGFFYIVSNYFKLYTIHWLLRNFFDNLFLIVIVLFQDDIRRALAYMGKNPFLGSGAGQIDRPGVDEIAKAAARLGGWGGRGGGGSAPRRSRERDSCPYTRARGGYRPGRAR